MALEVHRVLDAVWRIESARIIAGVARIVRDVGLAEELAQDALVAALEQWPRAGIPDNPAAWLSSVARMRAIDAIRRNDALARKRDALARDAERTMATAADDPAAYAAEEIHDDVLRLIFIAAHPVLAVDARVALTLRLVGGLTTEEIARAFLTPLATVQQRIVRAKRTLAAARVPFELPPPAERAARLGTVLDVIYLIFNEGYAATAGDTWMRPALCEDALRLGRVLAALVPDDGEVLGLIALLELQHSRARARVGADGAPILLADQDRGRWDRLHIARGLAALTRAEACGEPLGPFALQAAIAACHARARTLAETDWERIVALYDALFALQPSPVVALNRAVAIAMADGPAAALPLVDALAEDPALRAYHWLPSVRGDLLARLGRHDEARGAFEQAAFLARNPQERALLAARARR